MSESIPADLIGTREARELAGVPDAKLRAWLHSGLLPAYKRGYNILVSRSDVVRVAEEQMRIVPRRYHTKKQASRG